jgi:uncharacterized protein (DUF1499 family)
MRAMLVGLRPLALVLALAALILLALSGPGVRFGLWSFGTGFVLFRWTAYIAIATALVAAVALAMPRVRAQGVLLPMLALLIGLAVLYVPLQFLLRARSVPPINDITTDTENPPRYMTAPRAYPGPEVARQQRAANPDILPIALPVPPREAFAKAVAAAEAMGWEVVGRDSAAGTIEAVDTTKWFGFKDDIAIRVTPTPEGGSRIDIRSKSRVGRGDVGTNAQRIRAYAERLK